MAEQINRILPSDDIQLNVFLARLADKITDEELDKLKFFCSGSGGLRKGTLEKINNCLSLFTRLKEMRLLSSYNLVTLQAMIWHLERKDLYREFVEFCRNQDKTLYFFVPSELPTNGYRHVDFHIRGTENFNRDKLAELKSSLATLLCCPPQHIITEGNVPSNSLHITLMIPEQCIDFLLTLGEEDKGRLHSRGVDCFKIDETFVMCTDFKEQNNLPSLDKDAIVRQILEKNECLEKIVENYQVEILTVKKEVQEFAIDCEREMKYAIETKDEEIILLEKKVKEYELKCSQLDADLEASKSELSNYGKMDTVIYSRTSGQRLRRSLSQLSFNSLKSMSSLFQSKIIEMLEISNPCEITSEIMRYLDEDKDDVDQLKKKVFNLVNTDVFDDVYKAVLSLKSIQEAMIEKIKLGDHTFEEHSEDSDDCCSDA